MDRKKNRKSSFATRQHEKFMLEEDHVCSNLKAHHGYDILTIRPISSGRRTYLLILPPSLFSLSSKKIIHEHSVEEIWIAASGGAIRTPENSETDPFGEFTRSYLLRLTWCLACGLRVIRVGFYERYLQVSRARAVTHRLLIRTKEMERGNSGALLTQKTFIRLSFPRHKI